MTTPTITKHMITLPPVGKGVLHWEATQGQQVERGAAIARFVVGTVSHTVNAPVPGRLYCVTPDGITMQGGVPIGRVHEGEAGTPAAVPQMPSNAPKTPVPTIESKAASTPVMPQIVTVNAPKSDAAPTRRNAHVEPLEVVPITEPEKPTKSKKRRMVVRSFTISKADDTYLMNTARRLRKHADAPDEISESLLIRVGIAFLNSLSDEGIIKHLRSQIKTETKAGVGAGRRRRIR